MLPGDYCRQVVPALCDRQIACGVGVSAMRADCIAVQQAACENAMRPAIGGVMRFDVVAGSRCIATAGTTPCGPFVQVYVLSFFPTGCGPSDLQTGVADAGERCVSGGRFTCRGGFCPDDDGLGCTTCRPYLALGSACDVDDPNSRCEPDARCVQGGAGATCEPRLPDGASCGFTTDCLTRACLASLDGGSGLKCGVRSDGQGCTAHAHCPAQSYCRGSNGSSPGVCSPKAATGQSCVATRPAAAPCASSSEACLGGSCRVAPVWSAPTGSPCTENSHCSSDAYCAVLGAAVEGQCTPRLDAGSPCVVDTIVFNKVCQAGMTCAVTRPDGGATCAELRGPGDPYGWSQPLYLRCRPYLDPLSSTQACARLPQLGQSCSGSFAQCREGVCAIGLGASTCVNPGPVGAPCFEDQACASNSCVAPADGGQPRCGAACY